MSIIFYPTLESSFFPLHLSLIRVRHKKKLWEDTFNLSNMSFVYNLLVDYIKRDRKYTLDSCFVFGFVFHFPLYNKLYLVISKSVRFLKIFLQQCILKNIMDFSISIQLNGFYWFSCVSSPHLFTFICSQAWSESDFSIKNHNHTVYIWQITDYFRTFCHFQWRPSLMRFFRVVIVHNSTFNLSFTLFRIWSNSWTTPLTLILVSTEMTSYQDILNPPLPTEVKKSCGSLSLKNSLVDHLKPEH